MYSLSLMHFLMPKRPEYCPKTVFKPFSMSRLSQAAQSYTITWVVQSRYGQPQYAVQ